MSELVDRVMARCKLCSRWWSRRLGDPAGTMTHCACGGELEDVDMAAHLASLPRAPYDPTKDPKPAAKKEE